MKMKTVCCPTNETVNSLKTNETENFYCQTNETENSLLSDKWKWKQFVVRQMKLKTVCCQTNETENSLLSDKWNWR